MFELLGLCLALSGLLAIHSLGVLLSAVVWRGIALKADHWKASARARLLFWLRASPGLASILCIMALFVPAYLAYEPRASGEIVSLKLGSVAALSLVGICCALRHGFATFLATQRLVRDWLKQAEPVRIQNSQVPAFRLELQFPLIAIVGCIRPRLFIANQVLDTLSDAELSAAVAHENGHLAARDNLKRALLNVCRQALRIMPLGRNLDQAWMSAAESAADEYAARGGPSAALELASALVKVARLVPRGAQPAMLAGAALISEDFGRIKPRVLRLSQIASQGNCGRQWKQHFLPLVMGGCLSGALLTMFLTTLDSDPLAAVHSMLECIVSALQ